MERIAATIDSEQASANRWDAIVIGAGPAGSAAAIALAQQGAAVLLVDKCQFPRAKVCGCCVSADAVGLIESLGAGRLVRASVPQPIRALRLFAGGYVAELALRGGVALSRAALDAALVRRAIEAGAAFLHGVNVVATKASERERIVTARCGSTHVQFTACVVVAADGLAGRLANDSRGEVSRTSLMGASCVVRDGGGGSVNAGVICMACGCGGYAGAVRLEDGSLDVSAALNPAVARSMGGPAPMVDQLFARAGMPNIDGLREQHWKGTPLLTRSSTHRAQHRLLIAGDATGYVEPFTGEGIAWALRSGAAAGAVAAKGIAAWHPSLEATWEREHRSMFAWHWRRCRAITRLLRHPSLVVPAVAVLGVMPALATPLVRWVNGGSAHRPALVE